MKPRVEHSPGDVEAIHREGRTDSEIAQELEQARETLRLQWQHVLEAAATQPQGDAASTTLLHLVAELDAELTALQAELATIICDGKECGTLNLDVMGMVTSTSKACGMLFDRPDVWLVGNTPDVTLEGTKSEINQSASRMKDAEQGKPVPDIVRRHKTNGSRSFDGLQRLVATFGLLGELKGFVLTIRDLTRQQNCEERIAEARKSFDRALGLASKSGAGSADSRAEAVDANAPIKPDRSEVAAEADHGRTEG